MQSQIIQIPAFSDYRGCLGVVQEMSLGFEVKRVFYMWGMPPHAIRGRHALKTCAQLLIALSGQLTVTVWDGMSERVSYNLDEPTQGLYLPPRTWRSLHDFSPGAICLVLASEPYDISGYYRGHADFLEDVDAYTIR